MAQGGAVEPLRIHGEKVAGATGWSGDRPETTTAGVAGIGLVSASVLLAELPELGQVSYQALAALVGVAPFN